jgi:hypothetical protein
VINLTVCAKRLLTIDAFTFLPIKKPRDVFRPMLADRSFLTCFVIALLRQEIFSGAR